ncbi:hypothetical protein STEG23_013494, partial [Scotinomys teguina]
MRTEDASPPEREEAKCDCCMRKGRFTVCYVGKLEMFAKKKVKKGRHSFSMHVCISSACTCAFFFVLFSDLDWMLQT